MSFVAALQALVATGAFAARAFLPLFCLALVARFPGIVTWIPTCPDPPVILPASLAWLASPWCLVVLGVLSLAEGLADKDPDLRDVLAIIEGPVKALAAVVAALALTGTDEGALIGHVAGSSLAGDAGRLHAGALVVTGLAGFLSFALARWRRAGFEQLHDVADDIGLSRPLSWLEDAWVLMGLLLVLIAPLIALLGALALFGVVLVGRRALEARAEARRAPCPACRRPALPTAQACAGCSLALAPSAEPTSRAWPDRWPDAGREPSRSERGLELLGRGRCPACAERRPSAEILAGLPCSCGWPEAGEDIPGDAWRRELLHHVERRATRMMLPVAILCLVPIAGAATAIVVARMRISAPLRRWLPVTARLRARWTTRLLTILLLLASGIPLISVLAGPLIVAVTWRAWSRAFVAAA